MQLLAYSTHYVKENGPPFLYARYHRGNISKRGERERNAMERERKRRERGQDKSEGEKVSKRSGEKRAFLGREGGREDKRSKIGLCYTTETNRI